jgi:hypothetical protein
MTKKIKLKLNPYPIVADKIAEWIPYGIHRYYKYRDKEKEPEEMEAMVDQVLAAVMLGLAEVVDWGDDE